MDKIIGLLNGKLPEPCEGVIKFKIGFVKIALGNDVYVVLPESTYLKLKQIPIKKKTKKKNR